MYFFSLMKDKTKIKKDIRRCNEEDGVAIASEDEGMVDVQ